MKKIKDSRFTNQYTRLACVLCLALGSRFAILSSVALASPSQQDSQTPASTVPTKTADQYPQLPEGPGKATLIKTCGRCHTPTLVVANGQNRDGWEATVVKMVGLGAVGTDEDFTDVVDYLVKNFPPAAKVNMNKATASELQTQLGFSTKQAEDIIAYREKSGSFKSLEDLKKVPELDAKEIDTRRNRMSFE